MDKISNKLLKAAGQSICETLLYIFNLILEIGIFPEDLKQAKVTPVSSIIPALQQKNHAVSTWTRNPRMTSYLRVDHVDTTRGPRGHHAWSTWTRNPRMTSYLRVDHVDTTRGARGHVTLG